MILVQPSATMSSRLVNANDLNAIFIGAMLTLLHWDLNAEVNGHGVYGVRPESLLVPTAPYKADLDVNGKDVETPSQMPWKRPSIRRFPVRECPFLPPNIAQPRELLPLQVLLLLLLLLLQESSDSQKALAQPTRWDLTWLPAGAPSEFQQRSVVGAVVDLPQEENAVQDVCDLSTNGDPVKVKDTVLMRKFRI